MKSYSKVSHGINIRKLSKKTGIPYGTIWNHFRQGFCQYPRRFNHGNTDHPLYDTWDHMIRRCHNKNGTGYEYYGGRGISVCDRWRKSFQSFLNDVGPRPSKDHTLDRIDNNGNYSCTNIRWATREQQAYNKRRTKRKSEFGIQTHGRWHSFTFQKVKYKFLNYDEAVQEKLKLYKEIE